MQADNESAGRPRRQRTDALLNRERLLAAAKAAFAEVGADVSHEEIARRANVGVGTAYRNFPTRDAIIEAVYRAEVEHLANAAPQLLASMPAAEALHKWMHLSVDYVAAKRGLASALGLMINDGSELYSYSMGRLTQATTLLVERAIADGAIRDDVTPVDLLRAQIGFSYDKAHPDWQTSARRLVDIFVDGLKCKTRSQPRGRSRSSGR
ncbi:TetR/AcrR family transcriptional regulator [Bradyrhizobium genosp. P]|uniref:TetR/AcrR family transcriptional regulator n=1 Tax=Bradyrhizobium genosp. P TaxID=83641 RepID=UPI003CEB3ADC